MDPKTSTAEALLSALTSDPHTFLQPSQFTSDSVLTLLKHYLDPLALGITEEQLERQKEARRKRKRGQRDIENDKVLGLRRVHVTGFEVDQIWEQARRVLDAAKIEVENGLSTLIAEVTSETGSEEEGSDDSNGGEDKELNESKRVRFVDGEDDESDDESSPEDHMDDDEDASDAEEDVDGINGASAEDLEGDDEEDIEMDDEDSEQDDNGAAESYKEDPFGLNDGFFSIDDFNRQSEFLENQDVRGEDDGAASDEEDVDWNADPLAGGNAGLPGVSRERLEEPDEDEDDEEPAFGYMDLDAPEGASDVDEDANEDEDLNAEDVFGLTNANNIMYADFFAPPARKAGKSKGKRGRPHPASFPAAENEKLATPEDDLDEMGRTMAAVHRDLFSDSDHGDSDGSLTDPVPSGPKSRRSTHERRQAKLAEEIRRLEAENVAKRSWTLSGEARAADRPLNSLLEEDLEFERAGKPVPVITQEVSEDIEALIKRRILAQEFDELIRRRPDNLATGDAQARRGMFSLSDTKSSKGLAELYEEDHLRATDPNYVSEKDSKLAAAHAEISALWKDVSAKLDALSSWHYKPKPAMPSLEVRVDAPAITMEDARPTVGGEVGEASLLAAQEIYKPGMAKGKGEEGEVLTKGGLPVKKDEMSREEKAARRRREKERQKKANLNAPTRAVNGTNGTVANGANKKAKDTQERKEVLGALKKGGVKVIGKKGELTSVDGKAAKASGSERKAGVGAYKL